MNDAERPDWAANIDAIVRDPLRFKLKLDIGDEAYTSLRAKKYFLDAMDAGNGVITGIGVAKTSVVASTFFAPSGILGAIGIGTAATPLGWAIAAGVVGAGLSLTLGRYFVRGSSSRVRTIPDFINTPMDLLAIGLFDLIAMLGVKIASVDGELAGSEKTLMANYFVSEWGYDATYVVAGLREIERISENHTIKEIAKNLAEFKKQNPDCNYTSMSAEILKFLTEISEADGVVDEREEMAIDRVRQIFGEVGSFSLKKTVGAGAGRVAETGRKGIGALGSAASRIGDSVSSLRKKNSKVSPKEGPPGE